MSVRALQRTLHFEKEMASRFESDLNANNPNGEDDGALELTEDGQRVRRITPFTFPSRSTNPKRGL